MKPNASRVDLLFAKLSVRYGDAFLRQWSGADPELVKADWTEVLDGFSDAAIGYALRYLPTQPPNANTFREICRRAPEPEQARIAGPTVRADPTRVRQLIATVTEAKRDGLTSAERVAARLRQIEAANGGVLSEAQRHVLNACERHCAPLALMADQFEPVPQHVWPPGMQAEAKA
jgi:hypothetical protein